MANLPVIEHGESTHARQLRQNRVRIALVAAALEGVLVLVGVIPWWVVVAAAAAGLVGYAWLGREHHRPEVRHVTWILAVSQLIVVLVPMLAWVVKWLAILAIVGLAAFALVALFSDRR